MVHVGIVDSVDLSRQFINQCLASENGIISKPFRTVSQVEYYVSAATLDCLIIDAQAESGRGFSLIREIRMGNYECPYDIPIIACTTQLEKKEVLELAEFRVQCILIKPVSAINLKAKFAQCMQKNFLKEDTQYFKNLHDANPLVVDESQRAKASIVIEERATLKDISTKLENCKSHPRLITWPDNSSTGYHRLDSRLKNITSMINAIHWAVYNKRSVLNESHVQQLLLNVDDLNHVCKGLKDSYQEMTMWDYLISKLSRVKMIDFDELIAGKIPKDRVDRLFKIVRKRWLEVLKTLVVMDRPEMKQAS